MSDSYYKVVQLKRENAELRAKAQTCHVDAVNEEARANDLEQENAELRQQVQQLEKESRCKSATLHNLSLKAREQEAELRERVQKDRAILRLAKIHLEKARDHYNATADAQYGYRPARASAQRTQEVIEHVDSALAWESA